MKCENFLVLYVIDNSDAKVYKVLFSDELSEVEV